MARTPEVLVALSRESLGELISIVTCRAVAQSFSSEFFYEVQRAVHSAGGPELWARHKSNGDSALIDDLLEVA
jgi:hypothetical protein